MTTHILPLTGASHVAERSRSLTAQNRDRIGEEILNATCKPGDLVREAFATTSGILRTE